MYALFILCLVSCFLAAVIVAGYESINGYVPTHDVTEHSKIQLDFDEIATALKTFDFQTAYDVYSTGSNSMQSDGVTPRTIKGFSVPTLEGTYYQTFKNYWMIDEYANYFTSSACSVVGTDVYTPRTDPAVTDTSKVVGCLESIVFQNIWMYVIHEMAEAVKECRQGTTSGSHWDEAVAFYTGSEVGPTGANRGDMPFATAVKRCSEFGTCYDEAKTKANVNAKIFNLFVSGQNYYSALNCNELQETMDSIVSQMLIPHIQGLLGYAYYVDLSPTEKNRAELWSFAAAVLPMVYLNNRTMSFSIEGNTLLSTVPMTKGYAAVKAEIETLYPALGITCADVGGLVTSTTTSGYFEGMKPCSDATATTTTTSNNNNDKKHLPDYGIGLLVFFFLVIGCCVGLGAAYWYTRKNKRFGNTGLYSSRNEDFLMYSPKV